MVGTHWLCVTLRAAIVASERLGSNFSSMTRVAPMRSTVMAKRNGAA
jgi:hypothetical protein